MKYIFFDFFNTLFKTPSNINILHVAEEMKDVFDKEDLPNVVGLWNELYEQMETNAVFSGKEFDMQEISGKMSQIYPSYKPYVYECLTNLYMKQWEQEVDIFEDTEECIKSLYSKYSLGIISNTHNRDLVHNILRKYNLSKYFSPVVLSVCTGYRKPHPYLFEIAKCAGDIVCYVGDSYREDVQGALNCSINAILINRGMCKEIIDRGEYMIINNLCMIKELMIGEKGG